LIDLQNDKLAEICAAQPDRFVPLASVALQHPDLAAQQLEDARKKYNMRGAAIGCSVEGAELSDPKFDPFWAKAQELQMLLFMHPQNSDRATGITNRVRGPGVLGNVIGNPLETTIALSHLISMARSTGFRTYGSAARMAVATCRRTRIDPTMAVSSSRINAKG